MRAEAIKKKREKETRTDSVQRPAEKSRRIGGDEEQQEQAQEEQQEQAQEEQEQKEEEELVVFHDLSTSPQVKNYILGRVKYLLLFLVLLLLLFLVLHR